MFEAYLDESGIHDGSRVCVVAGYFGDNNKMRGLDAEWRDVLLRFKFPLEKFHAREIVDCAKYHPMLTELARVISKHKRVHPVSSAVLVDDFFSFSEKERRFMTGGTISTRTGELFNRGSGNPAKPYFLPFQNVLRTVTDHAPMGGKAHLSFALDSKFYGYAVDLIAQIKKQTELGPREWSSWESRDKLGTPFLPSASSTPLLQAADLFAYLYYSHMREWIESQKTVDGSETFYLCLRNACCPRDNRFQDKFCLSDILRQSDDILAAFGN